MLRYALFSVLLSITRSNEDGQIGCTPLPVGHAERSASLYCGHL